MKKSDIFKIASQVNEVCSKMIWGDFPCTIELEDGYTLEVSIPKRNWNKFVLKDKDGNVCGEAAENTAKSWRGLWITLLGELVFNV